MAMQRTPLLMSTLLENGARVAPRNEIVTATGSGAKMSQLMRKYAAVPINSHTPSRRPAYNRVIGWAPFFGTTIVILSATTPSAAWAR